LALRKSAAAASWFVAHARNERSDLHLPWSEHLLRLLFACSQRLARGAQLRTRALGPRLGTEAVERLERAAQTFARVRASPETPEPFAVGDLGWPRGGGVVIPERSLEPRTDLS
jgi:hypothetical protein